MQRDVSSHISGWKKPATYAVVLAAVSVVVAFGAFVSRDSGLFRGQMEGEEYCPSIEDLQLACTSYDAGGYFSGSLSNGDIGWEMDGGGFTCTYTYSVRADRTRLINNCEALNGTHNGHTLPITGGGATFTCENMEEPSCNGNDNCPGDPDKTEPGVCGCGEPDTDSDQDGVMDCNDQCENFDDASKECENGANCINCQCANGSVPDGNNACALCGDGNVQQGEECDDGNDVNTDACTNTCKNPVCGNGILQSGEECDGAEHCNVNCVCANNFEPDGQGGCECPAPKIIDPNDANYCTACGNNICEPNEANECGFCAQDCSAAECCGNGAVNPDLGEECDGIDGCTDQCACEEGRTLVGGECWCEIPLEGGTYGSCCEYMDTNGNGIIDDPDEAALTVGPGGSCGGPAICVWCFGDKGASCNVGYFQSCADCSDPNLDLDPDNDDPDWEPDPGCTCDNPNNMYCTATECSEPYTGACNNRCDLDTQENCYRVINGKRILRGEYSGNLSCIEPIGDGDPTCGMVSGGTTGGSGGNNGGLTGGTNGGTTGGTSGGDSGGDSGGTTGGDSGGGSSAGGSSTNSSNNSTGSTGSNGSNVSGGSNSSQFSVSFSSGFSSGNSSSQGSSDGSNASDSSDASSQFSFGSAQSSASSIVFSFGSSEFSSASISSSGSSLSSVFSSSLVSLSSSSSSFSFSFGFSNSFSAFSTSTGDEDDDGTFSSSSSSSFSGFSTSGASASAIAAAFCGDGIIQPERGEDCDLGSQNGVPGTASGCSCDPQLPTCVSPVPGMSWSACRWPRCGDGLVNNEILFNGFLVNFDLIPEECDDGNNRDGDGCSSLCAIEDEEDDDGDGDDDDGIPDNDDSDDTDDDSFASFSSRSRLSSGDNDDSDDGDGDDDDGIPDNDETDDDDFLPRLSSESAVSRSSETLVASAKICGNGILETGEECDDSNRRDNDGCSAECLLEIGICGDGIVQRLLGEQCEQSSHDTSLPYSCVRCQFVSQSCGDGTVDPGEECDDGPQNSTSPNANCRPNCRFGACGDGILDSSELCDDGNRLNGDGCDRYCRIQTDSSSSRTPTQVAGDQTDIPFTQQTPNQWPYGIQFPNQPTQQVLPYQLPLAQLQALNQTQAPAGDTGPAAVAVVGAGAAAGWSWIRRRRK